MNWYATAVFALIVCAVATVVCFASTMACLEYESARTSALVAIPTVALTVIDGLLIGVVF